MHDDSRTGDRGSEAGSPRSRDLRLIPYRNWALQRNVLAAFDGERPSASIVRPDEAGRAAEEHPDFSDPRGQAALLRDLEPDPEFHTRMKTAITLWLAALVADVINQWGPIGMKMPADAFTVTVAGIVAALVLTASVFPFLRPRPFVIFEQIVLAGAFALIVYHSRETGGAESPYAVWWLFTSFYAGQFFPPLRAYANAVVMSLLALMPLLYDASADDGNSPVVLALLIAVIWVIAITMVGGRREIHRVERLARFLALADPLTGVANLRSFERFVEASLKRRRPRFALVLADVNGLKGANAAFGYDVGDEILRRVAGLMRFACDSKAQVARIRGDEFAVLLPGGEEEAAAWCARFDEAVARHNDWVRGRMPQISVARGVAIAPRDGDTTAELIAIADRRMFDAKSRAVYPPYEVDVSAPVDANRMLQSDAVEDALPSRGSGNWGRHTGLRWALAAGIYLTWVATPGFDVPHRLAVIVLGLISLAFAVTFSIPAARRTPLLLRISDAATLATVAPAIWLTGGWQSPIQLVTFFPVAFYAQFMRGGAMVWRVVVVIGSYALAFWTSGPLGLADPHVGAAGETLFAVMVTAQLMTTLVLQANRRATDKAVGKIRAAATHDPLTGVHNIHALRGDLIEAIIAASRDGTDAAPPSLLIVDVDDFHRVNDEIGHLGGDGVLREIAERLAATVGSACKIYRIGCDEFAVSLTAERDDSARALAARVYANLRFYPTGGPRLSRPVTVCVGHATWSDGMSLESLVETAEHSLAVAKAARSHDEAPTNGAILL